MKRLVKILLVLILLAGWCAFLAAVHIIHTPEKLVVVPKNRIDFNPMNDLYIDTRAWTLKEAADHPIILQRIVDTDKADRFAHLGTEKELRKALLSIAATQPAH